MNPWVKMTEKYKPSDIQQSFRQQKHPNSWK